jgi:hypothetical protein
MGRLNKKITAKVGKPLSKHGLSRSNLAAIVSAKGLSLGSVLAKKDALTAALTSGDISKLSTPVTRLTPPSITSAGISSSANISSPSGEGNNHINTEKKAMTKKAIRATMVGQKRGVGKKERRLIRSELLKKRLSAAEVAKKAVKAKRVREKTVIVKDIQPLMENLQDIEEEIKKVS